MYTRSRPNRAPSDRAGRRGVNPSPSVIGSSPSRSGINSRYRHMVGLRPVRLSRDQARARSRSYRASSGAPQVHRWRRPCGSSVGAPHGTEHSRLEKYVRLLSKQLLILLPLLLVDLLDVAVRDLLDLVEALLLVVLRDLVVLQQLLQPFVRVPADLADAVPPALGQ